MMKYIIFLGDGMADEPLDQLEGRTPLQAADIPVIDRIAREGRCGILHTISDTNLPPGSETANLAVMGYDPHQVLQGRGVLEAAAMGVDIEPHQIGMRLNLITLEDGCIKNHSAGHISNEEAGQILITLQEELMPGHIHLHPGVSYRHLLVGDGLDPEIDCAQPHDHPGQPVEPLMIQARTGVAGETAGLLNDLTRRSWELLAGHPVNRKRIAEGKDPANSIWVWSPGRRPRMSTFRERFDISGAVISAVDLIRGIGVYAGLEVIQVEGATGLWETNYEGKADACLDALRSHDFVYVHVEGPDEAGHDGNLEHKIQAIEWLDSRLIQRVVKGLESSGTQAVMAVLPDHPTPVKGRIHTREPIPFAIRGPGIEADTVQTYDEVCCRAGGFGELNGDSFIRAVLGR
jgi:2,3-bisphosphoglycerate-independent phosphoglycerate mutase